MKEGLRYEKRLGKALAKSLGEKLDLGRWIKYSVGRKPRYCQPDAFYCNEQRLIVIEIKLSHRPDAEDKLRNLYAPVLEFIYPGRKVSLLQICRNLAWGDQPTKLKLLDIPTLSDDYSLIQWIR